MTHDEYIKRRDEITKQLSDSAEIARFSLESGGSNVAECYAKTEAAQLEAQQAIDALVLEREQALLEKIRLTVVKRGAPENYYGEVWEWIKDGVIVKEGNNV